MASATDRTKNGFTHGDFLGHPRRGCPLGCAHREWVETYRDARRIAEEEMERVTNGFPEEIRLYREAHPLPTLKDFMIHR